MPAVIGSALVILAASVIAGRALLRAFGRDRPTWMQGSIGFALLVVLAPLLIRLPGRATTATIIIAIALVAALAVMRRGFFAPNTEAGGGRPSRRAWRGAGGARAAVATSGGGGGSPSRGADQRAPHLAALATVIIVGAATCLPFLFNERVGILGEGIYTNDQAAQLYWTDWLANDTGPEPPAVQVGYPVGPQAVAALGAEATAASLEHAFDGLLVAIAVLTGLVALSALGALPPVRRVVAASLTALPYLAASFLAQSAFKETAMALFVLAFVIALGELGREGVPRRSTAAALVVLAVATVFTYSLPGLVWFALALVLWLAAELVLRRRPVEIEAARTAIARHRRIAVVTVIVIAAVVAAAAVPAASFVREVGKVQASSGRLASPVFPGEALAIWPKGNFQIVRGEVTGAIPAAAFGFVCVALGLLAAWRRRDTPLAAMVVAGAVIYAGARLEASIYVQAKALAVIAPVVAFTALKGLFSESPAASRRLPTAGVFSESPAASRQLAARSWQRRLPTAWLALGLLFAIGAAASTFLALRAAPMSFDRRGSELDALGSRIQGKSVIFLGVDRFAAYRLHGTRVEAPGGYVPPHIEPRRKWKQGEAVDFDTVSSHKLNRFRYAITTDASYQSTPPPNWSRVARDGGYLLWKRQGRTPIEKVLPGPRGAPGAVLPCGSRVATLTNGTATVLPRPAVGRPSRWNRLTPFDAPDTASQELRLGPGRWRLSIQYDSQVPLTVRAGGSSYRLPPTLDGMYLTHQGQGAWWDAGTVTVRRSQPVRVSVAAERPSWLQRLLGVRRQVWLGGVVASRAAPPQTLPIGQACGRYVDHYELAG
jgi:hypothetical protein